jgi:hypothetical protein
MIRLLQTVHHDLTDLDKSMLVLKESLTADLLKMDRYADNKRLNRYEHQVFSQNGEDGIIAEIIRRIGGADHSFVEIGVGDGLETNTTYLLCQGWRGYWFEADSHSVEAIRRRFKREISTGQLTAICAAVSVENICSLLVESGAPTDIDVLSLDIDRNTYWIWTALRNMRPRLVVIEYNSTFPPTIDWKVDHHPTRNWNGTAHFGASLKAMERLGDEMGYALVGCDLSGINAFFVRRELCQDHFLRPFSAENHYEPCRYFLQRRVAHRRAFGDDISLVS